MIRPLSRFIASVKTLTVFRINKCDKDIDEWFRVQLKNPIFTFESNNSTTTILLNGYSICLANRYYAGPCLYSYDNSTVEELPFIDTSYEFYKAYDEFIRQNKSSNKERLDRMVPRPCNKEENE